jgi:SAM-dependent methyltransferase
MKRNCAICGSSKKENLYSQRLIVPSANYVNSGYDVVICKECGFAYADNLPDQSDFDKYYKGVYKSAYELAKRISTECTKNDFETESDIRQHRHSLGNIICHLRTEDRILDVGCGSGHLLSLVKAHGYGYVSGLDPSDVACRTAKEKYGINVFHGSLFDDLDLGRFDFIILSQVLEHIADLRSFVSEVHKLIRESGRVYIEVPDAYNFILSHNPSAGLGWTYEQDLFAHFTPEHINFFSELSLQNLMTRLGFEKVFVESQVSIIGIVASVWKPCHIIHDQCIEPHLAEYIAAAKTMLDAPSRVIDRLVKTRQEILVWGAGLHTQRLLGCTNLGEANIRAFVDSNPQYQGEQLLGKPIISPEALMQFSPLPILISSRRLQDEIKRKIQTSGLKNPLVLLYSPQDNV